MKKCTDKCKLIIKIPDYKVCIKADYRNKVVQQLRLWAPSRETPHHRELAEYVVLQGLSFVSWTFVMKRPHLGKITRLHPLSVYEILADQHTHCTVVCPHWFHPADNKSILVFIVLLIVIQDQITILYVNEIIFGVCALLGCYAA